MKTSTPIEPKTFPNRIGYARVSSIGQNLDSQIDALKQAGCIKIFTDKLTGSRMERPGWEELLKYIRSDDTLVVTELSRMTRSLLHLLETANILEQRQINLLSLRESIDTTTATGRCFLSMMGAIHQMERELIFDRFHRIESQSLPPQHSTGLGLAIVKSIVDLHGGQLTVWSQVGKGSIFTVKFITSL